MADEESGGVAKQIAEEGRVVELYLDAAGIQSQFRELIEGLGRDMDCKVTIPEHLKRMSRIMEKVSEIILTILLWTRNFMV